MEQALAAKTCAAGLSMKCLPAAGSIVILGSTGAAKSRSGTDIRKGNPMSALHRYSTASLCLVLLCGLATGCSTTAGTTRVQEVIPAQVCGGNADSDGDGVNDCSDRCPNSQAGQAIGPDGCPVPLTIDLRGVNFDFDKSELRADAVQILDQAVSILSNYPEMRVEVAGHTDSVGSDEYNQALSQRRASAVYDFLTSRGIDAARISGPSGYGEQRPIAPNTNEDGSDNPEGRARNRRTELNVQN